MARREGSVIARLVASYALTLAGGLFSANLACAEALQSSPVIHLTGAAESLPADLVLLCSGAEPKLRDQTTGKTFPIGNAQLLAVAKKACSALTLGTPETGSVNIVNQGTSTIYVGFNGSINWDAGCTQSGTGVAIGPGKSCLATVASDNASTRFCASAGRVPDCTQAQDNHQTLVETTFQTSSQCAWLGKTGTCVWYDISIIPTGCTDAGWKKNKCGGDGGASYNYPVALTCTAQPTYTCQGPTSSKYGPQQYPKNCGNPDAQCVGNSASCVNAYFYPMYDPPENKYAPNSVCPGGATLNVTFLSGP
jgi:hypothetical protein